MSTIRELIEWSEAMAHELSSCASGAMHLNTANSLRECESILSRLKDCLEVSPVFRSHGELGKRVFVIPEFEQEINQALSNAEAKE